jgi:hypothetical protein
MEGRPMMGTVSLGMIAVPLASLPVDLSAILAPLAWIIAGLLMMSVIGMLVARERPGRAAHFISPTITLEEEEELLRRLAA